MREKIIIKSRNFNKFAPTHPLLNDCPTHPPLKDKESDKKKIKSSFIVLTLIFFSFFILGCGGVLAQTTPAGLNYQQNQFSNPQSQFYSPSFQSYYAQQGIDYTQFWPILSNSDECEARQDFIVNVRPGSCMPSVVRSDLLEEQNVPIFCKLDAIKLNPLIDVGAMKSVRFKGEYPKEIAGISFHPSQAALRIYNPILDSPILNDVGYAVVVLKKQESERTMPDSVKVDLTAVLTYDFQNVFGAGQTKYYVPVLNDFDWSQKYQDYGFWKGAGYVRVDWVETGRAGISVYSDSNNILRKFSLEKGQTSDLVYMPGFYCRAGVMIRLNEVSSAKPRARLQVDNEQEIWVVEGENFLDSQCVVKNIFGGVGGGGSVVLSCRGGDIVLSLGVLDTVKI
ncbi:MAG: hypothetical protein KJ559_02455, partial [Nanoarchaeota archaeon]|nr:hypothetical protein [Nanoarchaeota archaeon]